MKIAFVISRKVQDGGYGGNTEVYWAASWAGYIRNNRLTSEGLNKLSKMSASDFLSKCNGSSIVLLGFVTAGYVRHKAINDVEYLQSFLETTDDWPIWHMHKWEIQINSQREMLDFAKLASEAYLARENRATLVHYAAKHNMGWLLKTLLDYPDCLIDAKCIHGKTAWEWAMEANAEESLALLRKHPKQFAANLEAESRAELLQTMQQREAKLIRSIQAQMPWIHLDNELSVNNSNEGAHGAVASDIQSFYEGQVPVSQSQIANFPADDVAENFSIPEYFRCSITKQIMVDPVSTKMNQTYEREAIISWLDKQDSDPNTGSKLDSKKLSDNIFARQAIEAFLTQNPQLKMSNEVYLPSSSLKNLQNAIVKHDLYEVRNLIQSDKRLLARYIAFGGRTVFHVVCEKGTNEILEHILTVLSDEALNSILTLPRPTSWQPVVLNECLLIAAMQGDTKEMERVLHLGADIEARDAEWKTPLCLAAQANQPAAVNLLLTKGANISARDAQNNAPLDLAVLQGFNQISMRLLEEGVPSYKPTSPADQKQFSYMALKLAYDMAHGQRIENDVRATSSSSKVTTSTSTFTASKGFFAPPVSAVVANNSPVVVEPVDFDDLDDLKKTNKL